MYSQLLSKAAAGNVDSAWMPSPHTDSYIATLPLKPPIPFLKVRIRAAQCKPRVEAWGLVFPPGEKFARSDNPKGAAQEIICSARAHADMPTVNAYDCSLCGSGLNVSAETFYSCQAREDLLFRVKRGAF